MKTLTRKDFLALMPLSVGGAVALLSGCATTGPVVTNIIEGSLPLISIGAAVATGAVLNFAISDPTQRSQLANLMYPAANALYSLTAGSVPTPAQVQSTITAFGGNGALAALINELATAISSLYASWYPEIDSGDVKTASDLLNAIASGVESATKSYVSTPAPSSALLASLKHK